MDLDLGISAILKLIEKTKDLDVQDEYFLKYFDIYSDIEAVNNKILKETPKGTAISHLDKNGKIFNINTFLKIENDYDFIESVFMKVFGRVCEASTVSEILKRLKNNILTREDYLKILDNSVEAKEKNVHFTGFKEININEFNHLTDKDFVKTVFIKILKRHADTHGLKDFTIKLKIGDLSRNDVVKKIVYSNEAQGKELPHVIYSSSENCNKQNKTFFNKNRLNQSELEVISKDYDEIDRLEQVNQKLIFDNKHLHQRADALTSMIVSLTKRLEIVENLLNSKNKS